MIEENDKYEKCCKSKCEVRFLYFYRFIIGVLNAQITYTYVGTVDNHINEIYNTQPLVG